MSYLCHKRDKASKALPTRYIKEYIIVLWLRILCELRFLTIIKRGGIRCRKGYFLNILIAGLLPFL